jgi:hypothetical protein
LRANSSFKDENKLLNQKISNLEKEMEKIIIKRLSSSKQNFLFIQWPQRICHVCVCLRIFRVCVCVAFMHMLTHTHTISFAFTRLTHTRV